MRKKDRFARLLDLCSTTCPSGLAKAARPPVPPVGGTGLAGYRKRGNANAILLDLEKEKK